MHRFFLSASNIHDGTVTITGGDAHHIGFALRMRPGEEITVSDMQKNEYLCRISAITHDTVTAEIIETRGNETELPVRVHLYLSVAKGDKPEFAVEKATELGVYRIVFVESERCIVKTDAASRAKKQARYQKIAEGAAKQSGRGIVPEVVFSVPFSEALQMPQKDAVRLFCYEGDGTSSIRGQLSRNDDRDIHVFIGPEGGYSIAETEKARMAGFTLVGLGRRILRCETAPLFVLSAIIYETEL